MPEFQVISSDEDGGLPEYPFGVEDRLDSHHFVAWERRRWLNSGMRMKGTPEARAHYLDLLWIAYDQSPIGTLPDDMALLAKLLFVDRDRFEAMCREPYGPLHNWQRCVCEGGEVRLFHPMVLRTLNEAMARREDNRARSEAGNRAKRLQRLRIALADFSKDVAEMDTAVTWIDQWLVDNQVSYRNGKEIERALRAWSDHQMALGLARRK